jgi:hypothetical protein
MKPPSLIVLLVDVLGEKVKPSDREEAKKITGQRSPANPLFVPRG